jgi:FkbH-like protein
MTDPAAFFATDWAALRAELADSPLDLTQIYTNGQSIAALAEHETAAREAGITIQRIAVVSSLTTDFLVRVIACSVVQENVLPIIYQAPFGAYQQQVLDPSSGLHGFRPDIVVIAPDWRAETEDLPLNMPPADIAAHIDEKIRGFSQLWSIIANRLQARIIQETLVPPTWALCGPAERLCAASHENQVLALNRGLLEAGRGLVNWVQTDRLAARVGLEKWADEGGYNTARLPFALKFLGEYGVAFRAAWRSANACIKKVLVLDLDNTLWGGVIGDDGVEKIALGPGSPAGEAFHAWGKYIARLHARGVILAVCSKNNPDIALTAFSHKHMVLKRADFSAFECSWNDKASGLRRIAQDINVGVDSLVFADDNPAECEQVRTALPEVGVVHLGTDPTRFIALLDRGQWFDTPHYTAEDLGRGSAYAARAQAKAEQETAGDLSSYLAGLRMTAVLTEAAAADVTRLAQMEQKTNQFNLTTRRYGEATIEGFVRDPSAILLALRLADKFGDHGLVSSLIAVEEAGRLRIDSWLMSCRVFSRTAEQYMLRHLIGLARARELTEIHGEFQPTAKNSVVADLYQRLGFTRQDEEGTLWTLDISAHATLPDLQSFIAPADEPARSQEAA